MQLHVKGKNLEVSDPIRKYVERKVGKLDRQLSRRSEVEVEVEIELAVERNPSIAENQVAEAIVRLKGHTLRARAASSDMKASIDELTENLVRQIREERVKRRLRRKAVDKQALNDPRPPES